jgi:hypothetical protein
LTSLTKGRSSPHACYEMAYNNIHQFLREKSRPSRRGSARKSLVTDNGSRRGRFPRQYVQPAPACTAIKPLGTSPFANRIQTFQNGGLRKYPPMNAQLFINKCKIILAI